MTISSGLTALEYHQPDLVSVADWQQAADDGRRFIVQWGEQAEALGWTADDLFGLHDPPAQPVPTYRRLSRYDVMGLIWLLHGRPLVDLTADRAVIGRVGGPTFYRHPQARQVTPCAANSLADAAAVPQLAPEPTAPAAIPAEPVARRLGLADLRRAAQERRERSNPHAQGDRVDVAKIPSMGKDS